MTTIVIVEKTGSVKQVKVKKVSRDTLYSKCGFRKSDGFEKRNVWNVEVGEEYVVELWSRDDGNANTENKYDFPPPVDNDLYFGNCCVVRIDKETDEIVDLTTGEWKKIYEKLFGGFEDLVEEEASEDELENVPKNMKTHSGYLKDGFVVGTDSDDSDVEFLDVALSDGVVDSDEDDNVKSDVKSIVKSNDNDCDVHDSGDDDSDSELDMETYCYSDDE